MAVSWVLEHQTPEGAFYEATWLPDRNANSTIAVPLDSPLYRDAADHLKGTRVCYSKLMKYSETCSV